MARKFAKTDSWCDFETGSTGEETVATLRNIQQRLYTIDNPYVGNKRKIVVDIYKALEDAKVHFNSVVDVFSGSGVVSLFFKLLGKKVISNDLLTSSYYNAVAFVVNNEIELSEEDIDLLCNNNHPAKIPFVQNTYGERFTPEEAVWLDNYRANIDLLVDRTPEHEKKIKRALAFVLVEHYVMNKCFLGGRLNKGQILAQLEHRIQHNRNRSHLHSGAMSFNLKPLPLFASQIAHEAYNEDAEQMLLKEPVVADLAYIDPPYGGSQSDYAQMFAFCEEYIYHKKLEELPHIQSSKKFVNAKDYEEHFRTVLSHCVRFKTVAISYNDTSWADADTLQSIVKDYKKAVKLVKIDYKYNYRKEKNTSGTEYLIIAH